MINEELMKYIQKQRGLSKDRLIEYIQDKSGNTYPRRELFEKLKIQIDDFINKKSEMRWVIMPGLRGVGKTTLMAQLYEEFSDGCREDDLNLLFISLDEVVNLFNASFNDLIDSYEQLLGEAFERQKKPILLFIDEVQADPKWAFVVKSLYDRSKNIFVICSGSSAIDLQSNADVARRATFEKLYPLNFTQYQLIKNKINYDHGLKNSLKQILYFSNSADEVYEKLQKKQTDVNEYWSKVDKIDIENFLCTGTVPFAFKLQSDIQLYNAIQKLIDKIISKDIAHLGRFDTKSLDTIKRLLFILSEHETIALSNLSASLGIDRLTTTSILEVLEQAELIIKIPAHGSQLKSSRKPSKYLFMSPAIRMSFLNITGGLETFLTNRGKLLEDLTASHFVQEFTNKGIGSLFHDGSEKGADFILQVAHKNKLAIEVGLGKKDISQITQTMKKVKCDYGLVISNSQLALNSEEKTVKIPLDFFLLL